MAGVETEGGTEGAVEPPLVPGRPVIGCGLEAIRNPEAFLRRQYDRFGPVFRFKALTYDFVALAGPEANQFVNAHEAEIMTSRHAWGPLTDEWDAPHVILAMGGEDHQYLRQKYAPHMSGSVLSDHAAECLSIARGFCDTFADGSPVRLASKVLSLSATQIAYMLVGRIPARTVFDDNQFVFRTVTVNLMLRRIPSWLFPLVAGVRYHFAKRRNVRFADQLVNERRTMHELGLPRTPNYLDAVLEGMEERPDLFGKNDVRAAAMLPFVLGIDTMGQTLVWAVYELCRHPHIRAAVQDEIDAAWAEGEPGAEALLRMPVLRGVVMETLRMHPTAFGMARRATADFEFSGFRIREGQDIIVYTTLPHYLKEYFPDPHTFDIERYTGARQEHLQKGAYAPFGKGVHRCLGSSFGEGLLLVNLAQFLQRYDIEEADPDAQYKIVMTPTPSPGDAFRVRFHPRR